MPAPLIASDFVMRMGWSIRLFFKGGGLTLSWEGVCDCFGVQDIQLIKHSMLNGYHIRLNTNKPTRVDVGSSMMDVVGLSKLEFYLKILRYVW